MCGERCARSARRGIPALRVVARANARTAPAVSCKADVDALTGASSLRFRGYVLRGVWFREERYGPLRNAAWMLRNSRVGQVTNPAALLLVIAEARKLLSGGESLEDVLEAFAELLMHP